MNDLVINEKINIENMIYEVRGKQVMLASDVARLYEVETKRVNEIVKRNINRFPNSFCFQLTSEEIEVLPSRSQFATLNKNGNLRGYNIKYLPYVLTEQGIMMLSGLLKSDIAVKVNIQIIDAFVKLRKYISNNIEYINRISNIEAKIIDYDNKFNLIFEKLEQKEKINHIFFEGQIYDAYSLLVDILKESEKEIIIIDNYIDKSILDIISLLDKKVTIITNKYNNITVDKYKKQYDNLEIKINNKVHDRFIIIDKKILYHCGASFKDLGNKCFAITKIEDNQILNQLLERIMV